jgi:dihydroorotate dehydrogenase electron transfer subunit
MLSPGALAAAPRFDPLLPRPMAVYRTTACRDGGAQVEILYKVSGRGTALLAAARAGETIGVVGPLGRGFAAPAPGGDAILVGGGTGIASLLDLAASAQSVGRVRVLLGARTADDLMGVADFERLGVGVSVATEDGSRGRPGLVTALLEDALAAWPRATVYACGPTPMMRRAAELAEKAGCPCVVSLENPMACGFGVCLGCAAPRADGGFALVCRDGPVFAAHEIDWGRLG